MDPDIETILALEQKRCRAIVACDMDALRELLTDDLVHTHTRGNSQNRAEYLEYVGKEMVFKRVVRGVLTVKLYGDTAVVAGRLTNVVRMREMAEFVRVEAQVLQVWVRSGQSWRQTAFQATALGPPVNVGGGDDT